MARSLDSSEQELALRVTLLQPPAGVHFCLQRKTSELAGVTVSTGQDLSFDLTVRAQSGADGGAPRFLGPFTQGPPSARFVYICSGSMAGQSETCWSRRAKIPLTGITWRQVEQARKANVRLEARIKGTAGDGGPACATVPLLDGGWRLVSDALPE